MARLFICPACRTVHRWGTDVCRSCGTHLEWLAAQTALQPVLELPDAAPLPCRLSLQLRVAVRSPQGSQTVMMPLDENLRAESELLVERKFVFSVDRSEWRVTIKSTGESWSSPLSERDRTFGLELTCDLVCDVAGPSQPPPLDVRQPPDDVRFAEGVLALGRSSGSAQVVLPDPAVDPVHLLLAREPGADACWLVDHSDSGGVWVNAARVASRRLTGGDLVRVGPFAFVFEAREQLLVGVNEIRGAELQIAHLTIPGRLQAIRELTVPAGQFVAIAGPSGGGKSTLMKAIAGLPDVVAAGRVTLRRGGSVPVEQSQTAEFRRQLGYVSQDAFIHDELTVEQALGGVTEMQTGVVNLPEIRSWLKQLGLTSEELAIPAEGSPPVPKLISQLSGGQKQRVRTAAQLLREPSILLLDEPGSGLDPDIERQLMKMLAGLSRRGCTILIILHNLDMVRYCDRVLWVDKRDGESVGHLSADMAPGEFLDWIAAGRSPREQPGADVPAEPIVQPAVGTNPKQRRYAYAASWKRQFGAVIKREFQLLTGRAALFARLVVPVGLLPLLFAFSIAVGVNAENRDLFGFFAVLSSIWMGASVSLMSITNEREVYDHEHFLFLRITPYLCAKATAAAALSILQSTLFLLLLVIAGRMTGRKLLLTDWWGFDLWFCFVLVGIVAALLGLTISALAGRRRELAGFLLPLAMIFQIVFSVTVSMNEANTVRNVNRFFRITSADAGDGPEASEFHSKTNRAAVWLSCFTISRWGDQMLRSFAYYALPKDPDERSLAAWSYWGGVLWLLIDGAALLGLTILVLTAQENRRLRRMFALR